MQPIVLPTYSCKKFTILNLMNLSQLHTLFLVIFIGGFCCSWLLNFLLVKTASMWQIYDIPGREAHKQHQRSVPALGGIAMGLSWFILIILLINFQDIFLKNLPILSVFFQWPWLIGGGIILWLCGIIDDFFTCSAWSKLAIQCIAGICVTLSGVSLSLTPLPILNSIITIGFIVAVCNSINFFDNMNGLAGGISWLAFLSWFAIAEIGHNLFLLTQCCLWGAIVLGFLTHNFPKARIFMGDCGSLLLGYCLSVIYLLQFHILKTQNSIDAFSVLILPSFPLMLPLLDAVITLGIRVVEKRPIYIGDTSHLSHRLNSLGLSRIKVVVLLLIIQGIATIISWSFFWQRATIFVWSFTAIYMLILLAIESFTLYKRKVATTTSANHKKSAS